MDAALCATRVIVLFLWIPTYVDCGGRVTEERETRQMRSDIRLLFWSNDFLIECLCVFLPAMYMLVVFPFFYFLIVFATLTMKSEVKL